MSIRVVIADDQGLIRAGFRSLIDAASDLCVVGEAVNGREAVDLVRETRADVVVMDIRMPELDGVGATRLICADEDLAGVRVLILTTFELDEYVLEAVEAGASGFLGKSVDPEDLVQAIRTLAAGDALLSPKATRALISRYARPEVTGAAAGLDSTLLPALTDREREVVALVAHGLTNDDIAERLFVSPFTAKTHVNRAMMKVGARDRAQLVVAAYQSGLIRPGTAPA
ncbi:response regulator transcription factor [Aeromicrobium yanjiei]|uniref:Response regulator n=1 Tax=Aeromicrobium yanjiei TaxID=2662028 RepID=A0A5Q2MJP7_9ACTN|nr:response regulator transcription factor [Aeromicrobium yanjiei]QGG41252.1 response regulator [Aeromicrobium yanjiei]